MSWENDDFIPDAPAVGTVAAPPKPSSAEKRAAKQKEREIAKFTKRMKKEATIAKKATALRNGQALPEGPHVLNLSDQDLTALPTDIPAYAATEYLSLRGNKIHTLDASALPRTLRALDLRENGLREITGEFPDTLRFLYLDDNRLRKVPENLPEDIVQVTFTKNPLKKESVLGDVIEAFEDQTIIWLTTEAEAHKLNEMDMESFIVMTWPDTVFDQICLDSKVFIKKSICRDQITDEYIDSHLQSTKHLLLEIHRQEVLGMAIFDVRDTTIFVHLLCSSPRAPGGGTRIMKALIQYFKNHPTLTAIRLESVAGAKAFYSKIGFTPCFDGHLCPMEYQRGRLSPARTSSGSAPANSKTRKNKSKPKSTG